LDCYVQKTVINLDRGTYRIGKLLLALLHFKCLLYSSFDYSHRI
jgi:hypothetical protein